MRNGIGHIFVNIETIGVLHTLMCRYDNRLSSDIDLNNAYMIEDKRLVQKYPSWEGGRSLDIVYIYRLKIKLKYHKQYF